MESLRPVSGASTDLRLELLGVPVAIRTDDAELRARLAGCYAPSLTRELPGAAVLWTSIERAGEGWRIRVPGREEARATERTSALRVFNHELMHGVMLSARELYYVHAAVVEVQGVGVVFPGLSQAGKSTLALACLARGASYVSDELLAYEPVSARAQAFPRALKIRDVCVGFFPGFAAHFAGSGEGRFLSFAALRDDVIARTARIGAVALPTWSGIGGPTDLQPISPGEALLALASSSLNFGTHRARSLDWLAALVRDARAWRLLWSDPLLAAQQLETALGKRP